MPYIQAFRGIRYDLGHVGSLSNVIAPPYDVIDAELQQRLYDKHPANVVRLILNKDEAGDDEHDNRYTRAARLLRGWQRDGVLFTESDPAIYVYHQVFNEAGTELTRRGFMCRVRLERFGEGSIYPHEETHGSAKADRLKLWTACKANLSQIFGLYSDPENQAQDLLEAAIAGVPALEAVDHLGVVHRIWPVTDVATISAVIGAMGGRPVYIADGHHRYETACTLRDQIAAELANSLPPLGGEGRGGGRDRAAASPLPNPPHQGEGLPPDHPANFVLMMCVSMSDPGMLVLPTHRLFRGLPPISADQLKARLGSCFELEPAGEGPDRARSLWEEIELEADQSTFGLYTATDDRWTLARLTSAGRVRMDQAAADHSADWRGLGVSILHRLIIETLIRSEERGARSEESNSNDETSSSSFVIRHSSLTTPLPAPKYVRDIEEVIRGLKQGDDAGRDATGQAGTGGRFELAALVMPATVEHIRAISSHGERMPAKSTYFYPKLLSGLVINPLE